MKTIAAGKFKDQCLKLMDRVASTKTPVVVTKRGRPVVRIVPYTETPPKARTLVGSILAERGNPFTTGEEWDADVS
ncbi:MAG: type II toxin-antitoxin system prevent-host-death family antitoxin [Acidobacteria bacterium]|jgi:prevent-host-death family protein|nr:MAG: type II toxin-antitoxin system prevent-host-death family antitoxin [Acidobacteriota bacterium]